MRTRLTAILLVAVLVPLAVADDGYLQRRREQLEKIIAIKKAELSKLEDQLAELIGKTPEKEQVARSVPEKPLRLNQVVSGLPADARPEANDWSEFTRPKANLWLKEKMRGKAIDCAMVVDQISFVRITGDDVNTTKSWEVHLRIVPEKVFQDVDYVIVVSGGTPIGRYADASTIYVATDEAGAKKAKEYSKGQRARIRGTIEDIECNRIDKMNVVSIKVKDFPGDGF